jgi:hypothetical protein
MDGEATEIHNKIAVEKVMSCRERNVARLAVLVLRQKNA